MPMTRIVVAVDGINLTFIHVNTSSNHTLSFLRGFPFLRELLLPNHTPRTWPPSRRLLLPLPAPLFDQQDANPLRFAQLHHTVTQALSQSAVCPYPAHAPVYALGDGLRYPALEDCNVEYAAGAPSEPPANRHCTSGLN